VANSCSISALTLQRKMAVSVGISIEEISKKKKEATDKIA
jgi:hypothetical protein